MMADRIPLESAMDGTAAITRRLTRRSVLCAALPTLALGPISALGADSRVPIADMHSHFGIITRPTLSSSDFAEELRGQRVALIAWSLPSISAGSAPAARVSSRCATPRRGNSRCSFTSGWSG